MALDATIRRDIIISAKTILVVQKSNEDNKARASVFVKR
jgi:hypothetical protein